ncbi:MAG: hypothetical protein A2849_00535 [Candidatus Taylorbacteria bacterium RIFCSPHIGHO2_01_FULL_51_15]|uniref:Uncharacterized protein n=1 Tax=Candidatus Taylorbacteria bacterium RIFCSPHIGHO2_01_FULL_51_15 TaxID=1802304 RepID=A0A1G2MBJ2_9BACT|nr:MAG: hypothetical protein A2849_00535 [Candidatus Taylorbacteria bacterium RIFCSPHIGHO2_01_FULL_51_15]
MKFSLQSAIVLFVLAIAIVGGVLWSTRFATTAVENSPGLSRTYKHPILSEVYMSENASDTDGDGIPDWEEKLRGMDPNKPDSEVREASSGIIHDLTLPTLETPVSPSYRSATAIPTETPAIPLEAGSESASQDTAVSIELRTLLHSFGNNVGLALSLIFNQSFASEEQALFKNTVGTSSVDALKKLAPVGNAYKTVSETLRQVQPTPETRELLANLHRAYDRIGGAVLSLADAPTEIPILGERWTRYSEAALGVGKAVSDMIVFFKKQGVVFSPSEPGSIISY